jgi:hypothetical protein
MGGDEHMTREKYIRLARIASARPSIEPLEARNLMATCYVSRLGDFGAS